MSELNTYPSEEAICLRCGYSLRGLTFLRCPECGLPFDPNDKSSYKTRRLREVLLQPRTWNRRAVRFHALMMAVSVPFVWLLVSVHNAPFERERVTCIALSPDGKLLARASDEPLAVFEVQKGQIRATFPPAFRAAFSPDSSLLAAANFGGTVTIFDLARNEPRSTLDVHTQTVLLLVFSPDSHSLATSGQYGGYYGTVKIWDVVSGDLRRQIDAHEDTYAIAYSPDGELLATIGSDRSIRKTHIKVWDSETFQLRHTIEMQQYAICRKLAFSPNGQQLMTEDGVWDIEQGRKTDLIRDFSTIGEFPALVNNRRDLLTISRTRADHIVALSAADTGKTISSFTTHLGYHWDARLDSASQELTLAGHEGIVHVYDLASSRLVRSLRGLSFRGLAWHWYAIIVLFAVWSIAWFRDKPSASREPLEALGAKLNRSWVLFTIVVTAALAQACLLLWNFSPRTSPLSPLGLPCFLLVAQAVIAVVVIITGIVARVTFVAVAFCLLMLGCTGVLTFSIFAAVSASI